MLCFLQEARNRIFLEEEEQTLQITQATSLTDKATLVVTAADKKSKATYYVQFKVGLLADNTLKDIKFDTQLLVIMVRRGEDFFVPTGASELEAGDQLLIISDSAAEATEQYIEESDAEVKEHWGMLLINNTMDFAKQKWQQIIQPKKK